MFDENAAQRDGTIVRNTDRSAPFAVTPEDWVLSGPHFHLANPLSQTPKAICATHRAYDGLDLETLPDDYLPRSNYVPVCSPDEYRARTPRVSWLESGEVEPKRVTEYYRVVNREMMPSLRAPRLLSASSTAAALLLTTVTASAPVSSRISPSIRSSRSPRLPLARSNSRLSG